MPLGDEAKKEVKLLGGEGGGTDGGGLFHYRCLGNT